MQREDPIPRLKRDAAAKLVELFANWTAHDVAAYIGTDAQRVMEIRRGKLDRFSLETLVRYIERMGRHVDLTVSARRP